MPLAAGPNSGEKGCQKAKKASAVVGGLDGLNIPDLQRTSSSPRSPAIMRPLSPHQLSFTKGPKSQETRVESD
jgi:hypothetical protein